MQFVLTRAIDFTYQTVIDVMKWRGDGQNRDFHYQFPSLYKRKATVSLQTWYLLDECGLWLVITGIRQHRLYCLKGKTQGITTEIQFTAIIAAFANLPGCSIKLAESGSKQTYIQMSLGLIRKFSVYMGNKTNDQIVLFGQIIQRSHKWVRTTIHMCCINGHENRERILYYRTLHCLHVI